MPPFCQFALAVLVSVLLTFTVAAYNAPTLNAGLFFKDQVLWGPAGLVGIYPDRIPIGCKHLRS